MDGAGEHLFSRARLAEHQDVHVRLGGKFQILEASHKVGGFTQ
jgi:hypothetical protein